MRLVEAGDDDPLHVSSFTHCGTAGFKIQKYMHYHFVSSGVEDEGALSISVCSYAQTRATRSWVSPHLCQPLLMFAFQFAWAPVYACVLSVLLPQEQWMHIIMLLTVCLYA